MKICRPTSERGETMSLFKLGTVHVPHRKNTADKPSVRMPAPETVRIPMAHHIGAPARLAVKPGDEVFVGTLIGEAAGYVSAPVHSSVSGKVLKIEEYLAPNGKKMPAVVILSDGNMTPDPKIAPPSVESVEDLVLAARESGLVGLGGAGFPTAVKIDGARGGRVDTVVINAAECEPYITSDTRTMLDLAEDVFLGVSLIEKFIQPKAVVIGIEKNKPECVTKMRELFAGDALVSVKALPSEYPQGGEKILIYNTTGRIVPEGGLPSDVGVLVMNVTTVAFLAKYIRTGMPLVEKCLTVDGSAIKNPMNVIVPIGTSIADLIEFTGGFSEDAGKVFYGGPMMGVALYDLSLPILKNNNAIIALNRRDAEPPKSVACIHCGRCVAHCPMGLNPTAFAKAMAVSDEPERVERLLSSKINLCMECGTCSYVCPSKRPLVETNRMAKADVREYKAHLATLTEDKK